MTPTKIRTKTEIQIRIILAKLGQINAKEPSVQLDIKSFQTRVENALADDFNSPGMLGVIFELINSLNQNFDKISKKQALEIKRWLLSELTSLGFKNLDLEISPEVKAIVKKRELSRVNKQFEEADGLRKEAEALGYTIQDTANGQMIIPSPETKISAEEMGTTKEI